MPLHSILWHLFHRQQLEFILPYTDVTVHSSHSSFQWAVALSWAFFQHISCALQYYFDLNFAGNGKQYIFASSHMQMLLQVYVLHAVNRNIRKSAQWPLRQVFLNFVLWITIHFRKQFWFHEAFETHPGALTFKSKPKTGREQHCRKSVSALFWLQRKEIKEPMLNSFLPLTYLCRLLTMNGA